MHHLLKHQHAHSYFCLGVHVPPGVSIWGYMFIFEGTHILELFFHSKRIEAMKSDHLLFCQPRVEVTSCFVYKVMGLTFHDRINTQLIYKIVIAQVVARRITKPQRTFLGSNLTGCSFLFIFLFLFWRGGLILLFCSGLIIFHFIYFLLSFYFLSL